MRTWHKIISLVSFFILPFPKKHRCLPLGIGIPWRRPLPKNKNNEIPSSYPIIGFK